VKLARALFIVRSPSASGCGSAAPAAHRARAGAPGSFWDFLSAAALVTLVPALAVPGKIIAAGARKGLIVTLFLIGANLTRESIAKVGMRPLAMGCCCGWRWPG